MKHTHKMGKNKIRNWIPKYSNHIARTETQKNTKNKHLQHHKDINLARRLGRPMVLLEKNLSRPGSWLDRTILRLRPNPILEHRPKPEPKKPHGLARLIGHFQPLSKFRKKWKKCFGNYLHRQLVAACNTKLAVAWLPFLKRQLSRYPFFERCFKYRALTSRALYQGH